MRSVGIKVLKNKLSEYVRLASSGETVLVTDRDRVVAELCPPKAAADAHFETKWAEEIRRGIITPAKIPPGQLPPRKPPPVATWEELAEELARDREDR